MTEREAIHAMVAGAGIISADDGDDVVISCPSGHNHKVSSTDEAADYLAGFHHGSKFRLWLQQQGATETGIRIVLTVMPDGDRIFDQLESLHEGTVMEIGEERRVESQIYLEITMADLLQALPVGLDSKQYLSWLEENDPDALLQIMALRSSGI
jgi:hypothetical protein